METFISTSFSTDGLRNKNGYALHPIFRLKSSVENMNLIDGHNDETAGFIEKIGENKDILFKLTSF